MTSAGEPLAQPMCWMEASLVAGRFVPLAGSFAFDLAIGERVYFMLESAQSHSHPVWNERCAELCGLWHGSMAECVDYGGLSEDHRFLAFRVIRQLAGVRVPLSFERTRREVTAFLSSCGMDARTLNTPFQDVAERLVAVPTIERATHGHSDAKGIAAPTSAWFGVRLVQRPALQTVIEYLDASTTPGLSVHHVEAPLGSGGRTFLRWCAREARRRGYVPVNATALDWIRRQTQPCADEWFATLSRHHVVFLHDGRKRRLEDTPEIVRTLLRLGTRHARPPYIVFQLTASGGPPRRLHLGPLSERELVEMVVAPELSRRERRRIADAARLSRGRPGPFIARVATLFARGTGGKKSSGYTVHERSAVYGRLEQSSPRAVPPRTPPVRSLRALPHSSALTIRASMALRAKGRHAAADRALRQAETSAVRRGCWPSAVVAALSSAHLRGERGEIASPEKALERALEYADRAQDLVSTVMCVTEFGLLRLQDARVEQAESNLRTAVTASAMTGDLLAQRWSATSLALCLWWQARFDEASRVLQNAQPVGAKSAPRSLFWLESLYPTPAAVEITGECTAARVALGLEDPSSARVHLGHASELAVRSDDQGLLAHVRRVDICWHRTVGDAAGLKRAVDEAVRLSRAARQPLGRLCALVGYLEACLALGLRDATVALAVRRLEHASSRKLPGLLAFRVGLALSRFRGSVSADRIAATCAARRLAAISLDTTISGAGSPSPPVRSRMYDDVIEVLRVCQEEEPLAAVRAVADIVRARTRAMAVEFTAPGGAAVTVCGAGAVATDMGRRAIDTGLPIEPMESVRGMEAAVPLRFGGRIVGALGCRWPGAAPLETPRLMGLLKAVAAATAPCLAAILEQQTPDSRSPGTIELLGNSRAMELIRHAVLRAADAPYPVLIQGESGSGKELVARAIHRAGARRTRALCALNCAALPDDLLEAELFGHARGAFTGAAVERAGLFEEADGGVLFLDEVGELTPRAQAKLLRAIQEGEIKRIGETFPRRVDVRIVAATNRALDDEVGAGRFRADLRYRLDVVRIIVPPLRERPDDIPALVQHFWKIVTERVGSRAVISSSAHAALARYDWPGNVRELQNVLASLAVSAPRRGVVGPGALPAAIASNAARQVGATLESARRVFEERYVRAALARSGGHRGRAAAELGLTRQGLAKLMGRLGVMQPTDATALQAEPRAS